MGFGESGVDLNLNLNSSLTSGSGSDGEDYGIETRLGEETRPVLTMLSLSLLFLLLFASIYLLFNMGIG